MVITARLPMATGASTEAFTSGTAITNGIMTMGAISAAAGSAAEVGNIGPAAEEISATDRRKVVAGGIGTAQGACTKRHKTGGRGQFAGILK